MRLNKPSYEASRFTRQGFDLTDLYFLDGSTPPLELVDIFLELVKNEEGGIAIHCKAGLG